MSYFRQSGSQKTSVAAKSARYLQLWPVLAASDEGAYRKNHVPGTYLTTVPAPAQAQWTVGGASRTVVAGIVFGNVILARVPGCDAAPVHRVNVAQACNETDISNNQNILCIYLHGSTNWYTTLVKYRRISHLVFSSLLVWGKLNLSKHFLSALLGFNKHLTSICRISIPLRLNQFCEQVWFLALGLLKSLEFEKSLYSSFLVTIKVTGFPNFKLIRFVF